MASVNYMDAADPWAFTGTRLGTSRWIDVGQEMISAFGTITLDIDRMHMDPAWCAENSPFKGTIAYGFLTTSLLTAILNDIVERPLDELATLNYGFNRLRMMSPVRVGRRIRGHLDLVQLEERRPGRLVSTYDVEVEIEDETKPALVAQWLLVTDVERPRSRGPRAV